MVGRRRPQRAEWTTAMMKPAMRDKDAARDIAKPGPMMAGKRGLIMGVANDRSIAWGIARVLAGQGAKLAFTYQGEAFGRRAIPLAKQAGAEIIVDCDVTNIATIDNTFAEIKSKWGSLDFVVHALA